MIELSYQFNMNEYMRSIISQLIVIRDMCKRIVVA